MKLSPITLIILVLYLCLNAFSQSTYDAVRIMDQQTGFGARPLGMGGAYLAVAEDYSAVYWNPAGLAQIKNPEFWLGISNSRFANDIIYQESASEADNTATKFTSLGLVFPVPTYQGSLVFALGYQKTKDFEYANRFSGISSLGPAAGVNNLSFSGVDPNNPEAVYDFFGEPVQKEGYVTDEGSLEEWAAAGAIDVSPNISLGLTLIYQSGSSDYYDEFNQWDDLNNFQIFPADFSSYYEQRILFSKYSSFNMRFGSLFHLGRFAKIGLGIEIPQSINVKEDYVFDSQLTFDDGYVEPFEDSDQENSGTYEYDVKVPFKFSGGLSFTHRNFLLSGSAEYVDWTQIEFKSSELLYLNRYFNTDYRGTFKLRFGGEVDLPMITSKLRAGFIHDPNPAKGLSADHNRKYFTLGYGILIDRSFQFDLAYMLGTWKQMTYGDLSPEGTAEDIKFQKIMLTVSFRY
jgi:long-subunit fatty acid transport protein